MRGVDVYGESWAAARALQNSRQLWGGPLGLPHFGYASGVGAVYPPDWAVCESAGGFFGTTATRLYYIPYFFHEVFSFTGLKMRNMGAGDNGETLRLGAYTRNETTKMPASLIVDAGEITLTGAASDRTLAQSWTTPYVGWGYLAYHANSAADVLPCSVGDDSGLIGWANHGKFLFGVGSLATAGITGQNFGCFSVDTTYGALAATAVAPTAVQVIAPCVAPYKT